MNVVEVGADDFRRALLLDFPDFADAVQASCALKIGADAIITRDAAGFDGLDMPVLTPGAAL